MVMSCGYYQIFPIYACTGREQLLVSMCCTTCTQTAKFAMSLNSLDAFHGGGTMS